MTYISVTNALNDNSATSDITLVGTNFTDITNGLSDGTKDIKVAGVAATSVASSGAVSGTTGTFTGAVSSSAFSGPIGTQAAGSGVTGGLSVVVASSSNKKISSGSFVYTAGNTLYVLTSESGTSDQLDTCTGATEGALMILMAANTHSISIPHNVSSKGFANNGSATVTLSGIRETAMYLFYNNCWNMVGGFSDNGN